MLTKPVKRSLKRYSFSSMKVRRGTLFVNSWALLRRCKIGILNLNPCGWLLRFTYIIASGVFHIFNNVNYRAIFLMLDFRIERTQLRFLRHKGWHFSIFHLLSLLPANDAFTQQWLCVSEWEWKQKFKPSDNLNYV